jgi:hypothetical protein
MSQGIGATIIAKHTGSISPQPGTWNFWIGQVWVRCPKCHQSAPLDHEVHADGRIHPSLQCATDGCTFHVFARLEKWTMGYRDFRTG